MRKSELVREVSKTSGISQSDVEKVIDALEPVIVKHALEDGEEVLFPLGKFTRKVNKAREGKNPLTGEKIHINESHVLTFKPKKALKVVIETKKSSKKK